MSESNAKGDQKNTAIQVLDSVGNQILAGSIVKMADPHGSWSSYQALVVSPYSELEGEGYTVPVFFNREVCASNFSYSAYGAKFGDKEALILPVGQWDSLHTASCAKGEIDFLLKEENWKVCPRIRFFKPEELIVIQRWDLEVLCKRIFQRMWHTLYGLPFGGKFQAEEYQCWFEGCVEPALAEAALGNCWGTVSVYCLCKTHHKEVHGKCSDGFSPMKQSLFLADGRPLSREGKILTPVESRQ